MTMQDPTDAGPPRARDAGTWRRYLRFFGPKAIDDLDDELRFHVEMRVREYMARGMTEAAARAATARRLGDLAEARSECVTIATRRDRRFTRYEFMEDLRQDLAFALRTLGRNRGWTAIAILTLALGIGANSAMFSVVNHLLLNPLSYPDADRVVMLYREPLDGNPANTTVMVTPNPELVRAWREARALEAIESYATTDVMIEQRDAAPRAVRAARIRPTFIPFAGVSPLLGRVFDAGGAGEAAVAMISEGLWRSQYGADAQIVGKAVRVNGRPMTIVGVLPSSLRMPRTGDGDPALWLPIDEARETHGLRVIARLREGMSATAAREELDAIAARPGAAGADASQYRTQIRTFGEMVSFRDSLVLLSVAVALVLFIACTNVIHLLLARASVRQRELAIRNALGAGKGRLFRQLLTESLVLAAAGCAGGVLVGWGALTLLIRARPRSLSELASASMDGTTLLVTAGVAALAGVVFGVVGAVQASRHSTSEQLKAGAPSSGWGRGHGRTRSLLVMTEMALSTMLLVGAALLLRSVMHLQHKDLGFDPAGMYSLDVSLPEERYQSPESQQAFQAELLARVTRLPGVASVTAVSAPPTSTNYLLGVLHAEGTADPPAGATSLIPFNAVQADYFRFMGIPIVEGTTFTDTSAAASQAVVNRAMARKLWASESPLGRRVRVLYNGLGEWRTVVGVAGDAATAGYTADLGDPILYAPRSTASFFGSSLLVRTTADARFIPALMAVPASVDPMLPPPTVLAIEDAMRSTMARPRFTMMLLGIFAVVAVGLAAIGLYGVLAYSVALRTREIGIRMALGATRRVVARAVLAQGMVMAVVGAVIGAFAARKGVGLLSHALYGVQETDPVAFVGAAAVLVAIAALACVVPVRRAVSVDPLTAIRAD